MSQYTSVGAQGGGSNPPSGGGRQGFIGNGGPSGGQGQGPSGDRHGDPRTVCLERAGIRMATIINQKDNGHISIKTRVIDLKK
ncbi:hypothetical protein ARMSODRAFT_961541 [Armillaria solidipes]|uniref:Uncharacterized protein n=1 Tax=Armillaria solidipes TaxID=1076256 RepID=A0A2H3B247_9AGAR|nr:hypothetical protein ARMSODRAFT_961541 [Armillaria solidipes]